MQISCFEEFKLSTEVMKGINELGWNIPSPIQAKSIIPLLDGRDLVGQAQTGTGKTAAYGIPMIELVDTTLKYNQGLVLAPTRELAIQITDHLNKLGKYREVKILTVYGGDSMQRQAKALRSGVHIIVGTPGRILDHISKGTLNLKKTKIVVIDEADRMLDMGFIEDIQKILNNTPKDKQVSLFSATIGRNVMQICNKFMRYPEKIFVSKDEIALTQIDQFYVKVESYNKFKALLNIINEYNIKRAIVFCRTQLGAARLAKMLATKKFNAKTLHGGLTQPQRENVVEQFRKGKLNFLVATDVASRGLDIENITHIINHNVPSDPEVYFHRIGRTARMEKDGIAISLVGPEEMKDLNRIRGMTRTIINELNLGIIFTESSDKPKQTCAKCGKEFQANFAINDNRPVYCPTCYTNHQKNKKRYTNFNRN
ncbi:DEAD/DEAH box helicase [Candidatus Bathyarchaeota archaeon]|nr:DEAD/DEAH box helicase [Candidatus Bathyarchaeota archaeon]